MIRLAALALAACLTLTAQQKPKDAEQQDLDRALAEAGANPLEYLHAIEKHLERYPASARRPELERAAVRAAMEANDDGAVVEFGERVLARAPDDLPVLDRVAKALAAADSKDGWERAIKYARRYEELVRQMQRTPAGGGAGAGDWRDQTDRGMARALTCEARATGNLGRAQDALALARRAFETYPNAESIREAARWCEQLGQFEDAARALADAFTVPDPRTTDADRARDRGRMGELYRQAKGSEAGLGDLVLEAYDRNVALVHARQLRLRSGDPNGQLTNPMDFTLGGVDGGKLSMAGLKGKVIVLDFWATWCGPCRTQHPLYEQVKKRFASNSEVVFLSIDSDEERQVVKPFLTEAKWTGPVYFEDGLCRALSVFGLPTTVVIDRQGRVSGVLTGYVPGRFADMLAERIGDALKAR